MLESGGRGRVELQGATNETVGFAFRLNARNGAIKNAELTVESFAGNSGKLDPSSVQVFRRHAVAIDHWPGWHIRSLSPAERNPSPLDALVPLHAPRGGWTGQWRANETADFWADVVIPKGTESGTYEAAVNLRASGKTIATLRLGIVVLPFVLPDELDISVLAEVDHRALIRHHIAVNGRSYAPPTDDWSEDPRGQDIDRLLRSTIVQLRQHGLMPVLHRFAPIVRLSARGELTPDWSAYDRVVQPSIDGTAYANRVPSRHWPLPLDERSRALLLDSSDREKIERWCVQFMVETARHFQERGWNERAYFFLDSGSVPTPSEVERLRTIREIRDRARGEWPVVCSLWPQDLGPFGWTKYPPWNAGSLVDVWMPNAQFFDSAEMKSQRDAGRGTWMRVDRPPFSGSIDVRAPECYARILPWQAERLGAGTLVLGEVNSWPEPDSNPTPTDCIRTNAETLIYPGRAFGLDEPIASMRLKELRRGMQDIAYLRLLRDQRLDHLSDAVASSMVRAAGADAYHTSFADGGAPGWATSEATFEQARAIMANGLIERARGGVGSADPFEEFAENSVWRRFMASTRNLQLEENGVRIRPSRDSGESPISLEAVVTIRNQKRVPLTGHLKWSGEKDTNDHDANGTELTINRGSARLASLRTGLAGLVAWPNGITTLPLSFDAGAETAEIPMRAACVMADRLDSPIHIDGDLSDWPLGGGNVAGGFRLISGANDDAHSTMTVDPRRKTIALVAVNNGNLLVALNGEGRYEKPSQHPRRNTVEYDDMMPLGDDLVELLFDPLNSGSRSPADLYHVTIKRSGMVLTERGVNLDPPCGTVGVWASGIEAAVVERGDRWTAELRIPLTAFEPAATRQTVWGFNVTRFDDVNEEFSTWSGAVRNAYDPLSLGNLFLP